MREKRYTISELQDLTNTNRRTIHFYSQRGLIPGPDSRGGAATYPEEAYIKLKIIKELQKRRYTLDEINELFEQDYEKLKEKFIADSKEASMPQVATKEQLQEHLEKNTVDIMQRAMREPEVQYFEDLLEDGFINDRYRREVIDETVKKIKVAEGIELHIDEETFKRYRNYIKRGVIHFQDILAEKRRGRPRKDRIL